MAVGKVLKRRKRISFILLSILSIAWIVPILWVVSTSFKPEIDAIKFPINWIPENFTLENYKYVLSDFDNAPIMKWFFNSFFNASVHTFLYLVIASMAAYAYGVLKFKHRDKMFWLLISTMMIPGVMNLIPLYTIVFKIGWLNTRWAMIIPGLGGIFGIFLLRQFFLGIPRDLFDSAKIDGASHFKVYYKIVLPLAKPALVVVGLFTFMGNWNDFLWPLIVTDDNLVRTLPVGLALLQGQYNIYYARLMAATVISIIPVLIIFLFAQKFFIQGISMTGMKE